MMNAESAGILIVGSLNIDFVVTVDRLPARGETVDGSAFVTLPGGKGANQACAVGRLGGRGVILGAVGRDVYGEQLVHSLSESGIETSFIKVTAKAATGAAFIAVERGGQNQIIVAAGANACLSPEDVRGPMAACDARFVLLQLETPLATVEAAAQQAKAQGMVVILDPAPARALNQTLLECVDILTPNESEAQALLGRSGNEIALDEAREIAAALRALGPQCVILKLGANGAWLDDGTKSRHFPTRQVEAVDVTAAGDCFNGALAVGLAEGWVLEEAVAFANGAASIAVTRMGAQASIPERAEVSAVRQG